MRRIFLTIVALAVVLSAQLYAETVEGYLVDKMCSAEVVQGGVDAAAAHTKKCALMPDCKTSGYGVVTEDGKFLKFDKDGDEMALQMLDLADGPDKVKVSVSGTIKGDTIAVIAIQRSFS